MCGISRVTTELKVSLAFCGVLLVTVFMWKVPLLQNSMTRKGTSETYAVDMEALFDFVPYGLLYCEDLFKANKELPTGFNEKFEQYQQKVNQFKRVEGYSAQFREEFLVYLRLVQFPFVRTVCETGFNAGHSAFTWLEANPGTHVYSFDIGEHAYAAKMAEYLTSQYRGRFNITWGDSTVTLPDFHRRHPDVTCDLLVIDGGHNSDVCRSDLESFRRMASPGHNVLVLDNYPDRRRDWMDSLGRVWEGGKRRGEISETFHCRYKHNPQGFSVGRILG